MINHVNVHADSEKSCFVLTGAIDAIKNNRRLLLSFKRLGYREEDGNIIIPYESHQQIEILKEVQELLAKFDLASHLSEDTRKEVESFHREEETFAEFTNKARDIRNDSFDDTPELVEEFKDFQAVLKDKIIRTLYPLQLLSAYHLAFSQNACNFSVPGAGKTSIVYSAYAYLKSLPSDHPRHVDKLLVIGPLSSFISWEDEYELCFGRKTTVQRLSGDSTISRSEKEQHLYSGSPSELTLIYHGGVDGLQDQIVDFLKKNKTMVVVDEAHRIKNPEGVWGKSIVEIAKEARARVVLTGTPVPNGYEDLFNLYQFLYPFKYKDILGFHYGNLVDMSKNSEPDSPRVKSFISNITPFFIRIKKKDLDLPPVKEQVIEIEMDQRQREIYDFIETKYIRSFQQDSSGTVKDTLNKAKLIRLRQAAINPALLTKPIRETLSADDIESRGQYMDSLPEEFQDDSEILSKIFGYSQDNVPSKFSAVYDLISGSIIPKQGKVIIWTIFIQNAKELQNFLKDKGISSQLLIGEVEQNDREDIIRKFNNPDNLDFQVVIANPFSVSESISLHKGCHNAVYLERDYNCANFIQSKDRIHRIGLLPTQETNYYYFLSKDSIDQVVHDRLNIKVERMEKVIDAEIPLFTRINDADETDIIKALIDEYAKRT